MSGPINKPIKPNRKPFEANEPDPNLKLLNEKYPIRAGFKRTIKFLWNDVELKTSYYRVNYYDSVRERFIKTCFISISEGKIKEWSEIKKEKTS